MPETFEVQNGKKLDSLEFKKQSRDIDESCGVYINIQTRTCETNQRLVKSKTCVF